MKTVTLWNVPVEIAEIALKALRDKAGDMITDGEPVSEVQKLLYAIETIEEEISRTDEP